LPRTKKGNSVSGQAIQRRVDPSNKTKHGHEKQSPTQNRAPSAVAPELCNLGKAWTSGMKTESWGANHRKKKGTKQKGSAIGGRGTPHRRKNTTKKKKKPPPKKTKKVGRGRWAGELKNEPSKSSGKPAQKNPNPPSQRQDHATKTGRKARLCGRKMKKKRRMLGPPNKGGGGEK